MLLIINILNIAVTIGYCITVLTHVEDPVKGEVWRLNHHEHCVNIIDCSEGSVTYSLVDGNFNHEHKIKLFKSLYKKIT